MAKLSKALDNMAELSKAFDNRAFFGKDAGDEPDGGAQAQVGDDLADSRVPGECYWQPDVETLREDWDRVINELARTEARN